MPISRQILQVAGAEKSINLVTKSLKAGESGASLVDVLDAPLGDEGFFGASSHHSETGTLADQPWVVIGETRGVGILASCDKSHVYVVDQIVEQLAKELGEPPHTHKVTSSGVVFALPGSHLCLVQLLLVVISVELDDSKRHLLINGGIEIIVLFSERLNHKLLILAHDLGFFGNI